MALPTVVIIMFALSAVAMALGSSVVGTASSTVTTRDSLEARAAADAGLSAAVAQARRAGSSPCGVNVSSSNPIYSASSTCTSDEVHFTSLGTGSDGASASLSAVYEFVPAMVPGAGGDLIFFGNATFTSGVTVGSADGAPIGVQMPGGGSFNCHSMVIKGDLNIKGNFATNGACDIEGNLSVGGTFNNVNGTARFRGNVSVSGTALARAEGQFDANLATGGPINFGWNSRTVGGNVSAGGNVNLANQNIAGSLTLRTGNQLQVDGWINTTSPNQSPGRVFGGINWVSTYEPPSPPVFDPWFEYKFAASDWPGFSVVTANCADFAHHTGVGWTNLSNYTAPTIVDARGCAGVLSSGNGGTKHVNLNTDIVLLANGFKLQTIIFEAGGAASPNLWVVVEDTVANTPPAPTCTGGRSIELNGAHISPSIRVMGYTPCGFQIAGMAGAIRDTWVGTIYSGGNFTWGSGFDYTAATLGLPGMDVGGTGGGGAGGTGVLGEFVSQRVTE